ncbi:MAG: urease accessory protein UreE [Pseudomonadota bacterium]
MNRAGSVLEAGDVRCDATAYRVTLTRDDRYRRRIAMTSDCGRQFLLDLPEATYLPDGCGLLLDNGDVVQVVAASEPLLEIRADTPGTLARLAWHVGNRHTPAEILKDAIYIQPDHVLAEMIEGLGGMVSTVERPFEPEGGAYGHHGTLHESHHHGAGGHRAHTHDHEM